MKTRKHKLGLVTLLFVTAVLMSGISYAQQGPGQGKGQACQKQKQNFCMTIPDLTPEQKEKIEELHLKRMKDVQQHQLKVKELSAQLKQLETADDPDMKAINAKIDEISALKTKAAKEKAEHKQEVRNLLTDEQKVYFDAHSSKCCGGGHKAHGCSHKQKAKCPKGGN